MRRVFNSLDPIRGCVCVVCVWGARLGPNSRVCNTHPAGQVLSHVQPHHIPVHRLQKLIHEKLLFQSFEETETLQQFKVSAELDSLAISLIA